MAPLLARPVEEEECKTLSYTKCNVLREEKEVSACGQDYEEVSFVKQNCPTENSHLVLSFLS